MSTQRIATVTCTVALAALVTIAVEAAATSASPEAQASSPPACRTSGLDVWLDTQGNGAAGSVFYEIQFTNLSGHTCTLQGYPRVRAVDLSGNGLGSPARREETGTPHNVKLAAGATAVGTLRITEAGNFSPSDCHPVTAAGLRVTPPGQTRSRLVPFPFEFCSKPGHQNISIRAVQRE
jgi:hypothetical protein